MLRQAALVIGLLCLSTSASAQVQEGNFKLGLDTSLFSFTNIKSSDTVLGRDYEISDRTLSLGLGDHSAFAGLPGPVGLTFGYVAHPHVIPQLHLGFGHITGETKSKVAGNSRSEDKATIGLLMLRPEVEIPFNPGSSVVGYGLAGFDFRHGKVSQDSAVGPDSKLNGFGPVLGAGLHIFAVPQASFDLGAQFSYLVLHSEVDGEDNDGDQSSISFGLTAGVTLWP